MRRLRRLGLSVLGASMLVLVPSLLITGAVQALWIDRFEWSVMLLVPGMALAMGRADNAHSYSTKVTILGAWVFWAAVLYVLMTFVSYPGRALYADRQKHR